MGSKVAGVLSYVLYSEESNYGVYVAPATHFGIVRNFSSQMSNTPIMSRGFKGNAVTDRGIVKIKTGQRSASCTVDFEPVNWTWLKYVLNAVTTGDGSVGTPFQYTMGQSLYKSLSISHNLDDDTDREEKFVGMVVQSLSIRCSVGEPVTCSLQFVGKDMSTDAALASAVALPAGDVFTFDGGDIEWPDATSLKGTDVIDSVTVNLDAGGAVRIGLGATTAVRGVVKGFTASLDFTLKDPTEVVNASFLAGTTPGSVQLRFTNGANKFFELNFVGAYPADRSENAPVQDDFTEEHKVNCLYVTATERTT